MTAERPSTAFPGRNASPGGFLTDRRLRLFFVLLLAAGTVARVLFSVFPKIAATYSDELFYLEAAQNLWLRGTLSVYGAPIQFTKILYSVLIAPFYTVADGMLRTQMLSGFNALLLSSSLIPGWLLARKMLKNNLNIALCMLFLTLSPNLLLSMTFMAENLYYPLLMWSLYALYCFLSAEKTQPGQALLLGFLAFLLYLAEEGGAAFFIGLAAVLLLRRSFPSLGAAAAGFMVPALIVRFTVFPGRPLFSDEVAARFSTAPDLMYLLYGALLTALFFLCSVLWFPVAVPVLRRRNLAAENRDFLAFSVSFMIPLILETAFLLLAQKMKLQPAVILRTLGCGAFPFLLLYFASMEHSGENRNKAILTSTGVLAALTLLFLYLPAAGRLPDAPALSFIDRIITASAPAEWITKGVLLLLFGLLLVLYLLKKQKAGAYILLTLLLVLEAAACVPFVQAAREEETVLEDDTAAEVRALDAALDELSGNTLIIVPDPEAKELLLLNTLSARDYTVACEADLLSLFPWETPPASAAWAVDPAEIPAPSGLSAFLSGYGRATFENIVTLGTWHMLDPRQNRESAPNEGALFHIYKSGDPSRLNLLVPYNYKLGDEIRFQGNNPGFENYLPSGFSDPEENFTWSSGTETSLTFAPVLSEARELMVTWRWFMTNGEQPCEVYANGVLVRSETLSNEEKDIIFCIPADCYAETGTIVLRFVFPEAREPGNGDTRILAVAFDSLFIE